MTRLIDADDVLKEISSSDDVFVTEAEQEYLWERIQMLPTVDAVPIRHGKWLDPETLKRPWFRHHIFECSVCRNILDMDGVNAGRGDANYCPNCGARMDERKEE